MVERGGNRGIEAVVLLIAVISSFRLSFLLSSVNIALPTIGKDLAMDAISLGWVITATFLVSAAFLIPFGRLADIYGRRRIFLYGIALSIIASFLCAIAGSSMWLIIARVLQGIANAMTINMSVAILTSVFAPHVRGRAIGLNMAATFTGLSIGPFLGGLLIENFEWRSIFLTSTVLGLLVIILILFKLKGEWADAKGETFDLIGSLFFSFSLVIVIYGFTVLPRLLGIVLFILGSLFMLAFMRWEGRIEYPIINLRLLRNNATFAFSNLATLISYIAASAVLFFLSLYLQYIKGFSPQSTGLILLAQSVVMVIFSPIAGRLSDRFQPRIIAAIGMGFNVLALVLFSFLSETAGLGFIIFGLAIYGLAIGLFSSPNINVIMGSVGKNLLGVASSAVATGRTMGSTLSISIIMIIFSIFIGRTQITPEYYPDFLVSMKIGFVVFAVLCLGGMFVQLAGREK